MKQSAIVRLGGIRAVAIFLLNIAGALISILLLPAALLYPIASGHRPVVEVRDEAGIYHEQALRHGLEEQVYDREVRIAVLSVPGSGISNIDEEIVKYASDGTQGSSWFKDSDVDSPVNGTILFVVAPESHWVRCYAAKDLQLSADKRTAIENAAGSHYAQSDWDDGTVAMGRQLATYIGSSDGSSMIVRVVGGVLAFPVGTGWLVYYLWRGMTARRRAQGARHEMMRIVYTYDLTELQAGTVPEGSSRAGTLAPTTDDFMTSTTPSASYGRTSGSRTVLSGLVVVFSLRPLASLRGRLDWLSSTPLSTQAPRPGRTRPRILGVQCCEEAANGI